MVLAWAAALAAGFGAVCRYAAGQLIGNRSGFPWGTFAVNVSGSFLLGVIAGLAARGAFPATATVIVGVGFCGGFTTFSTWMRETLELTRARAQSLAAAYVLGSLAAGLVAAGVGLWAARG